MSAPSGDEPGPGEEEENDLLGLLDDELQQLADSNSDDDESSNDDVEDAASNNDFPGDDEVDELNGHQEVEDSLLEDDDDDGAELGNWTFLDNFPVRVVIDSVDQDLLEQAREEVKIVMDRIRTKIFGRRRRPPKLDTITPSQFLQAWMDGNLLAHMKTFINQNLTGDPVSSSDIIAFVRVELMLSFYRVSPNLYFDPAERGNFPSAGQGLSLKRYKEILCGLSSSPGSGSKKTLIERILASGGDESSSSLAKPKKAVDILLGSWFMAPFGSANHATRIGSINEANVLPRISMFIDQNSTFHIEEIKEYGLLCMKGLFYMAFSPDGVAVVVSAFYGRFLALIEIKSRVTANTIAEENEIQNSRGSFVSVNISTYPDQFKELIPDTAHRAQLLHGMVCAKVQQAFYVVASLSRIIRVVHVHILSDTAIAYIAAMSRVHEYELTWVLQGLSLPEFTREHMGHAIDLYTIKSSLALWRAINESVRVRGRPFPLGRMIIPSVVAMWNHSKGPIDVFSRFLKNCQARHSKLPPLANIWLRLILSRVYNAFQSFVLSQSYEFLMSDECKCYDAFQRCKRVQGGCFAQFCSKLASHLLIEVPGNFLDDDSSNSETEDANARGALLVREGDGTVEVAYKKREKCFKDRELIKQRMGRPHTHVAARGEKPRSCVWCCRRKHNARSMRNHISRHGRATKFYCLVCMVSLCNVKRFDGQSCHDLFHNSTQLVDYCVAAMDSEVHVQPHSNRPPPPR